MMRDTFWGDPYVHPKVFVTFFLDRVEGDVWYEKNKKKKEAPFSLWSLVFIFLPVQFILLFLFLLTLTFLDPLYVSQQPILDWCLDDPSPRPTHGPHADRALDWQSQSMFFVRHHRPSTGLPDQDQDRSLFRKKERDGRHLLPNQGRLTLPLWDLCGAGWKGKKGKTIRPS